MGPTAARADMMRSGGSGGREGGDRMAERRTNLNNAAIETGLVQLTGASRKAFWSH